MFSCACSLRSSQCAALIALATAAGISRFEAAPAHPTAPVASQRQEEGNSAVYRANFYEAAMQSLARWFPLVGVQESINGGQPAPIAPGFGVTPLAVQPATESAEHRFSRSAATPTARKHSYPYAVGPPRRGIHEPLREDGTVVSGDSSVRRRLVSRVAIVSVPILRVHLTCAVDRGPRLARSPSSPNPALRGKPGFNPSPSGFSPTLPVAVRASVHASSGTAPLSS